MGCIVAPAAPAALVAGTAAHASDAASGDGGGEENPASAAGAEGSEGEDLSEAPDDDGSGWPCNKIKLQGAYGAKIPCAIVTTGAMNPMHRGHVQLLHQASQRLGAAGYHVIAAWVSPSHDGYVQPKAKRFGTLGLSAKFRLKVAQLATEQDPLVAAASWECMYPKRWPDFPVVVQNLQEHLDGRYPALREGSGCGRVPVFYACGTDHANKCNLWTGLRNGEGCGVVVVPRDSDRVKAEKPGSRVFVADPAPGDVKAFSSTKVRGAISDNDAPAVQNAMSLPAARFLLAPSPEERAEFWEDYTKLGVPV